MNIRVATVLTACGIETCNSTCRFWLRRARCNSAYRLRYWNSDLVATKDIAFNPVATVLTACGIETLDDRYLLPEMVNQLQQYLPLAVCDEGCEAAEEQSDDEARISLVPDWKEGKTKVMK